MSSCSKSTDQLFDEAYVLTTKNQYDKAIIKYNKILERNNKFQLAYYNRGYCYYSKNEYSKALEDFNRIIQLQTGGSQMIFTLNSDSPFASEESKYQVSYYDALYQRAQVCFYLGKNKDSYNDFDVLIASNYEEKSNCYLWQGSIWQNNGDSARACTCFTNAKAFANKKSIATEAENKLQAYCR